MRTQLAPQIPGRTSILLNKAHPRVTRPTAKPLLIENNCWLCGTRIGSAGQAKDRFVDFLEGPLIGLNPALDCARVLMLERDLEASRLSTSGDDGREQGANEVDDPGDEGVVLSISANVADVTANDLTRSVVVKIQLPASFVDQVDKLLVTRQRVEA